MPVYGPSRAGGRWEGPGDSPLESQLGRARLLSEPHPHQTPALPHTEGLRAPSWEPEGPGRRCHFSPACWSFLVAVWTHKALPHALDSWTPDLTPAFNPVTLWAKPLRLQGGKRLLPRSPRSSSPGPRGWDQSPWRRGTATASATGQRWALDVSSFALGRMWMCPASSTPPSTCRASDLLSRNILGN